MERKDKNDLYRKKLSVFTDLYRLYKHCYVQTEDKEKTTLKQNIL